MSVKVPEFADDKAREKIKNRIQSRLVSLGLNQFDAAKLTGKNAHFIYDFMIDRKREFKGDGLYRLGVVLQCSIDYLLGRSDDVGQPPPPRMAFVPVNPIEPEKEVSNG